MRGLSNVNWGVSATFSIVMGTKKETVLKVSSDWNGKLSPAVPLLCPKCYSGTFLLTCKTVSVR
jgi:hypothetical protein